MKKVIPFIIILCFVFCSCGIKKESSHKNETKDKNNDVILQYADVTQDGILDEIRINLYVLEDINTMNKYSDDTVEIFSGKTKEKIWGKRISTIHMEQDGLYVYNDGEKDYILEMCLYMNQGQAVYKYKVLKLSENGDEVEKYNEDIKFSVNEGETKLEDQNEINKFETSVNKYLEKSYVILDTNYNSEINYSTESDKKILLCDLKNVLNEIIPKSKNKG